MGNCTGYCNGCREDGQRFDNNQIRSSVKDNNLMLSDGFAERYSYQQDNNHSQYGNNNNQNGSQMRQLKNSNYKVEGGAGNQMNMNNHEHMFQSDIAGGQNFQHIEGEEVDDKGRVQRGPVTLKNGATYTG